MYNLCVITVILFKSELINTCCRIIQYRVLNELIWIFNFHILFFWIPLKTNTCVKFDLTNNCFSDSVKMSTWDLFENPKHITLIPKTMIERSQLQKRLFSSWVINLSIPGSIIIKAYLTLWYKRFISPWKNTCGNQLKWLLEYKKSKSELWTGTFIGVGLNVNFFFYLCMWYVQYILT